MNAKKLTAGCLAALVAVESLLGVISPAYAGTAYSQMTADHKNVFVKSGTLPDAGLPK